MKCSGYSQGNLPEGTDTRYGELCPILGFKRCKCCTESNVQAALQGTPWKALTLLIGEWERSQSPQLKLKHPCREHRTRKAHRPAKQAERFQAQKYLYNFNSVENCTDESDGMLTTIHVKTIGGRTISVRCDTCKAVEQIMEHIEKKEQEYPKSSSTS